MNMLKDDMREYLSKRMAERKADRASNFKRMLNKLFPDSENLSIQETRQGDFVFYLENDKRLINGSSYYVKYQFRFLWYWFTYDGEIETTEDLAEVWLE